MEFDVGESLCKAVCNHLVSWNVREFDPFRGHVTDVVVLDIDVFGPRVEDRIMGQSHRSLVVTFQWDDDFFLSPPTRYVKI